MVGEAVVVLEAVSDPLNSARCGVVARLAYVPQHQLRALLATLPPRGHHTPRRLPLKFLDKPIALVHDRRLLLQRHGCRVLMRIPMQPNFVSFLHDHSALLGKCFQGVAGDEPRGLDVVLVEHVQQSTDADGTREEAARDVRGRILATIGPEPSGHCIDVDRYAALDSWGGLDVLLLVEVRGVLFLTIVVD